MNHNIYLSQEDKAKLYKQAFNKNLSVSVFVDIIAQNYLALTNNEENYINKGNIKCHLKLRKNSNYTDMELTNAVYLYLHGNTTKYKELNLTKINRSIQSQSDKKIDYSFMKNQLIRLNYRNKK